MPRLSRTAAALLTIPVIALSACTPSDTQSASSSAPTLPTIPYAPSSTTTTSAPAEATDYQVLLLTAADISDDEDTFTERSRDANPDGQTGASAFFVNDKDNRAIADTVLIYPDAATATATLKQAAGTLPQLVEGGTPEPVPVGTDGTVLSGTSPDGSKAVTLLLFTQGRALVRLEFQSAPGDTTTPDFVNNIGKMQQIALRVGLNDPE